MILTNGVAELLLFFFLFFVFSFLFFLSLVYQCLVLDPLIKAKTPKATNQSRDFSKHEAPYHLEAFNLHHRSQSLKTLPSCKTVQIDDLRVVRKQWGLP